MVVIRIKDGRSPSEVGKDADPVSGRAEFPRLRVVTAWGERRVSEELADFGGLP
jgi:hypothetical protein